MKYSQGEIPRPLLSGFQFDIQEIRMSGKPAAADPPCIRDCIPK